MYGRGANSLNWVFVAAVALASTGCFGPDPASDGYSEQRFDQLVDAARGRSVPVTVLRPHQTEPPQPAPLIILSHGGAAGRSSYRYLATHLARNGYVVAIPEHVGSNTAALVRGIIHRLSGPSTVTAAMAQDRSEWRARPADITFVVDEAARWNASDPALRSSIDLAHIGVLGHSYGAYTALAVAGARVWLDDTLSDLGDPRVRAMVALSPSGPGGWGWFTEESYANVDIPALLVTGSRDIVTEWQTGEWRKQAFDLMAPGERYCLWLEGATHFDFVDLSFQGGRSERVHRIVEAMVLAFFDKQLKAEPGSSDHRLSAEYAGRLAGPGIPEVRLITREPAMQRAPDTEPSPRAED